MSKKTIKTKEEGIVNKFILGEEVFFVKECNIHKGTVDKIKVDMAEGATDVRYRIYCPDPYYACGEGQFMDDVWEENIYNLEQHRGLYDRLKTAESFLERANCNELTRKDMEGSN